MSQPALARALQRLSAQRASSFLHTTNPFIWVISGLTFRLGPATPPAAAAQPNTAAACAIAWGRCKACAVVCQRWRHAQDVVLGTATPPAAATQRQHRGSTFLLLCSRMELSNAAEHVIAPKNVDYCRTQPTASTELRHHSMLELPSSLFCGARNILAPAHLRPSHSCLHYCNASTRTQKKPQAPRLPVQYTGPETYYAGPRDKLGPLLEAAEHHLHLVLQV